MRHLHDSSTLNVASNVSFVIKWFVLHILHSIAKFPSFSGFAGFFLILFVILFKQFLHIICVPLTWLNDSWKLTSRIFENFKFRFWLLTSQLIHVDETVSINLSCAFLVNKEWSGYIKDIAFSLLNTPWQIQTWLELSRLLFCFSKI